MGDVIWNGLWNDDPTVRLERHGSLGMPFKWFMSERRQICFARGSLCQSKDKTQFILIRY